MDYGLANYPGFVTHLHYSSSLLRVLYSGSAVSHSACSAIAWWVLGMLHCPARGQRLKTRSGWNNISKQPYCSSSQSQAWIKEEVNANLLGSVIKPYLTNQTI